VARARRRWRWLVAVALTSIALGSGYAFWAVEQVKREGENGAGFDAPIARLERLGAARRAALRTLPAQTDLERRLVTELDGRERTTARLLVMVIRLLVGSALVTAGIAALTVVLAERPLIALLAALGERPPSP
jgi:uncharacterized membrane protein YphA (DoxX/SURF4 family)